MLAPSYINKQQKQLELLYYTITLQLRINNLLQLRLIFTVVTGSRL